MAAHVACIDRKGYRVVMACRSLWWFDSISSV